MVDLQWIGNPFSVLGGVGGLVIRMGDMEILKQKLQ